MNKFNKQWKPPETVPSLLAGRLEDLRIALQSRNPEMVARLSGIPYFPSVSGDGEMRISLLGDLCTLIWPSLLGYDAQTNPLPDFQLTLLLYYLFTADGTPLTGKWVSFAELPGGRTYNTAFQGYSGDQLARSFQSNLDTFRDACTSVGGKEIEVGSRSFVFEPLPRLPMMITYWLGDEDFRSSCTILFDESAFHYLPIDACAILGSMLTRKLVKRRSTI